MTDARSPSQLTSPPVTAVEAAPYPFEMSLADTALVIIDMQRDFLQPGGFGASSATTSACCARDPAAGRRPRTPPARPG